MKLWTSLPLRAKKHNILKWNRKCYAICRLIHSFNLKIYLRINSHNYLTIFLNQTTPNFKTDLSNFKWKQISRKVNRRSSQRTICGNLHLLWAGSSLQRKSKWVCHTRSKLGKWNHMFCQTNLQNPFSLVVCPKSA